MHAHFWWYRLHFWQWTQAGRAHPMRRAGALLAWWVPSVIAPLVLHWVSPAASGAALNFLLTLDVPLTLVLAGATTMDALGVGSRTGGEDWITPSGIRRMPLRWMVRQRWLYVARWPAGFVIAASLLATGASSPPELLSEARLMAVLGLVCGSAFAWAMHRPTTLQRLPAGIHRLQGVAALSWIAFRDARERFDPRRAALLAVPALLAAPMGASAGQVARALSVWLPLLFVLIVCREAMHVQGALRRWLGVTRRSPLWLTYWVWRFVALGIAAITALGIAWLMFRTPTGVMRR